MTINYVPESAFLHSHWYSITCTQ